MNGGLAVVGRGRTEGLPLPIAGLMSKRPAREVARRLRRLEDFARKLGSPMRHPFMTLSFMTLSVIPELKLTARGLVDVRNREIVDLFEPALAKPVGARAG